MEDKERNANFDYDRETFESHANYDESSAEVESKSEREEAPVFGLIPLFAIIGALLAILVALMPSGSGGLLLGISTLAVLIVGAALLFFRMQQRRR